MNSPFVWFIIVGLLFFIFFAPHHKTTTTPTCFAHNDNLETNNGQVYYTPVPCESSK